MSSVGSFGTFTTARLAIYVSQKGLSVTGNNIANINTKGYTRQRLDQVSFKTGGSDRYQNSYDMRVGNGAIAKSVSQLRDPYLDIRYRAEHSSEGFYNGKLNGLDQIATVLDEIGRGKDSKGKEGDGLLYAQFSDFFKSLQYLQSSAGTEVNDTLVFNSADALCKLFQSNADRLERLKLNTETQLRQNIDDINDLLVSIRDLNQSIEQAEIYGDGALELRDERNNLIDDLSEKLKIDATYSMVNVGGQQVEKLTIRLGNANPNKDVTSDSSILVDGNYCAQLTTPKANEKYDEAYAIFDRDSEAYKAALKILKSAPVVANPDAPATPFTSTEALKQAIGDFKAAHPDDLKPYRYLDGAGKGTNDITQKDKDNGDNDDYDPAYELFDDQSDAYQAAVAVLDQATKVTDPRLDNPPFTSEAELNAAIAKLTLTPDEVRKTYRYLDQNGDGTNDITQKDKENPDYVPGYELFDKNSDAYKAAALDLDTVPGTEVADPRLDNLPFTSIADLNKAIKNLSDDEARKTFLYLDAAGDGTNDINESIRYNNKYNKAYDLFNQDSDAYKAAVADLAAGKEVADPRNPGATFPPGTDLNDVIANLTPSERRQTFRYLNEKNLGTNDIYKSIRHNDKYDPTYDLFNPDSDAYKAAVEELAKAQVVTDPLHPDTPIRTVEQLEQAIDEALKNPAAMSQAYPYLDPNGEATNDPRKADQVFDDQYNITITDLRDKNDKAWVDRPDVRDTYVNDASTFPQKAKLTGSFQITGGEWKDGDTINISVGGTDYSIEVGKDLSAAAANEDPKNVSNAIRKALLKNQDLAENYDITTKTTRVVINGKDGFNVDLTVKAKNPELKANAPDITIGTPPNGGNAQPAGSFTFGKLTEVPPPATPRSYTVSVAKGNEFHKGETITIGTAPNQTALVVGKDISVNAANNPERLAAVLANKMNVTGYSITASTTKDGTILTFKAAAADTPALTEAALATDFKEAEPAEISALGNVQWYEGKNIDVVNGDPVVDLTPDPEIVDNGDNTTSKVTTSYYMDDNDKWHKVVRTVTSSKEKLLDDNDLFGELQAVRELLTEEGEFSSQEDIDMDENASIKRGIPYYQRCLDLLARKFADILNEANTGYAVDEKGNYLSTETDADGAQIPLLGPDGNPINKVTGPTDAQKTALEADALGNYIKANWAGFVKDADGNDTNVLADKSGEPLTVGGTELTTSNVKIDTTVLRKSDVVGVKDGKLVDKDGNEVKGKVDFTLAAFGTVPAAADPANPTPEETEAINKAQAEIDAKKAAATADLNGQALDSYLAANGGDKLGGNLFSVRGDTDDAEGITAANISVAQSWSKGLVHVVPTFTKLFGGGTGNTTQNDNALHMGNLIDRDLVYNPQDLLDDAVSNHLFEGSFQDMFVKMSNTLGNDQRSTGRSLLNHTGQALDIDTSRDSVSAVDLNDEAMDLMQYTHSLNAAYRLMTTIDEMIERLITGTGVTR